MNTKYPKAIGIWLAAFAFALTGCGVSEAFQDVLRTDAAIKAELGLESHSNWERINGHARVQVHLVAPPPGDAAVTKREITAVVMRTFRSPIERVDVEF